jgi:hypothetical protein
MSECTVEEKKVFFIVEWIFYIFYPIIRFPIPFRCVPHISFLILFFTLKILYFFAASAFATATAMLLLLLLFSFSLFSLN